MKNSFVQFAAKFLLFALLTAVLDFFVGTVLQHLQQASFEKNPARFEVRAMYAIDKGDADVAIIGASDASHSYISQMIEDSLHLTTFNYGKDGCFFVYQNTLINLMLDRYTPKVILWEIGKGCIEGNDERNAKEWQSISDFYPYYDRNEYCRKVVQYKDSYQKWRMLSKTYRYNSRLLSMLEPFLISEAVPDTKGYLPLPNTGYCYPVFVESASSIGEVDDYKETMLRETLNLCKEKGIKVVFCFSPKYQRDAFEGTAPYEKLKEMAEEEHIGIIDYMNHLRFVSDSTLFKDNAHLNNKGARTFMEFFVPDLKRLLVDL